MVVTIHDVAMEAGVSIATVSRVINNNYPVKDETRKKVQRAVEKLGYIPNEIARSLILKSTSSIGIVVPGINNPFFSTIVEEINRVLIEKEFTVSFYSTEGDPLIEKSVIESIISRNMAGIVAIDPSAENLENHYFQSLFSNTPTIIINGNSTKYGSNFVSYNEGAGARQAFEYLLDLGHKKISFIRGDKSLSYDIKEAAYRDFIKEKGLSFENVVFVGKGNNLEVVEKAEKIIGALLKADKVGTALFACNDLMAVGVLKACNKVGIRVPEDLSLIGFDNTLLSSITHPKITTVDLKMKKLGHAVALELDQMIKKRYLKTEKIVYDTQLILRESCMKIN